MATGDTSDIFRRLKSLIPSGWVGPTSPRRDAIFGGLSDSLSNAYGLLQTVRSGTRRLGTFGWLLDVDAYGFFGPNLSRRQGEADDAFRKRYTDEIFRERVTRKGISKALEDLTGRAPKIIETWNAADCGAYDGVGIAYAGSDFVQSPSGFYDSSGAYDIGLTSYDVLTGAAGNISAGMGCWGSLDPFQLFVTAYRPLGGGIPGAAGTDIGVQGYDIGAFQYTDQSEISSPVSDAEIYAVVAATQAAGITAWTAIQDAPAVPVNISITVGASTSLDELVLLF